MGLFDFFKSKKKDHKVTVETSTQMDELRCIGGCCGVCDTPLDAKYTPDNITILGRRDIFVFGSNLAGHHGGGAARVALNRFGAIWGQGEGLQGNSYAIPTMQGGVETIKPYVDNFIEFAEYEKALTFYVTKIGCGIAGFRIEQIAPLFRNAYNLPNVILPIEFAVYIENENRSIHPQKILDTIEAAHEERVNHFSTPIKVIGIGGAGTNSVERMIENPLKNVEYFVLNTDEHVIQSKVKLKGLLEGLTNDPCGIVPRGFSEEWFNKYYATESNSAFVHYKIDRSADHVIIVAGYGGITGTFGSKWIVNLCKKAGIPVTVVCTIPFDFEGKRKQERALDVANSLLANGIDIKILYAEDLNQKYSDISFFDCFSLLDEYVAETVCKLCEEISGSNNGVGEIPNPGINKLPCEVTTHCYGMTRTFADIILALNEDRQYSSPDTAIADLGAYMQRFSERGDNVAFLAVRILQCVLHDEPEIFINGVLNTDRLRELMFQDKYVHSKIDKAYLLYCKEKLMNLVAYLNEFRRYTKPEELRKDLFENTDVLQFSACAPIPGFYYFIMSGASAMDYPVQFFVRAIRKFWSKITTDGVLDADKMKKIMFGNHDDAVRQLGLEDTIKRDYIEDSPCHPEVFVPKVMGTAPVYVKDSETGRYIRSCGEGKGPNSIPDWLEFQIAKQILECDKSYKLIGNYYIPKYDNTLPVYGKYSGRIVFNTQVEKLQFIEDVKKGKNVWR